MIPPIPKDEPRRLEALRRYEILDTPPEPAFDDLTRLASQVCDAPMAMLSLVDAERQWFKSRVAVPVEETSRDISFCAHAIGGRDIFEVPDASADPRFEDNPYVVGESGIRFYAGAPLLTPDGHALGTLCVMDQRPRTLSPAQTDALRALSRQVVAQLELRRRLLVERHGAEEALHEKEESLRVVVDQLPAVLWTTDRELRFVDSAGAGLAALDQKPGDNRGTSLFAYFRTTDPNFEPIAAHRRALKGESVTYGILWKGRAFQSHVEPLRDVDGSIRGVLGVAFDVTELQQTHEALEKSVALLNATIDATADAILVVDAAGQLAHFNRRFVDLWGIPEEMAERRDHEETLAFVLGRLKDPAAFAKKILTARAQPDAAVHDLIELKDGRLIERDSLPQIVDGRTAGRVWSFRDVTERRREGEDREEALSLLQATIEATADGILVVDNAGRIVSYNRKFVEMWGIPDSILASRDDNEAIAFVLDQLRDPERFVRKIRELYDRPEAQSYDWLEFKDGRLFERYSHPQKIDGKTVGRVWSFHDVTRLRLMEDTLRRQARAFEHISDGVVLMDLEGRIVDWNPGAEKMFGYSKAEMVGKTPAALGTAEGEKDITRTMLQGMRSQGRWTGEVPFLRKDGTRGVCDTVVVPLSDEFGRTLAALSVSRDVTDRKKLEQHLRESNGVRGDATSPAAGGPGDLEVPRDKPQRETNP
jgi:PAS domain S-box-containing protein